MAILFNFHSTTCQLIHQERTRRRIMKDLDYYQEGRINLGKLCDGKWKFRSGLTGHITRFVFTLFEPRYLSHKSQRQEITVINPIKKRDILIHVMKT